LGNHICAILSEQENSIADSANEGGTDQNECSSPNSNLSQQRNSLLIIDPEKHEFRQEGLVDREAT
jgi:hypothetical protein